MTIFQKLVGSRWFYLGVPIIAFCFSLFALFGLVVAGAVDAHYHAVVPKNWIATYMWVILGLAAASLVSLLTMVIAKFVFKSALRTSLLAYVMLCWAAGAGYIVAVSPADETAYHRIFEEQKYSIPWNRVPGELTSTGNPTEKWSAVKNIGYRYCAEPFETKPESLISCKIGTFLAGARGVDSHPLYNDPNDPEGLKLYEHLKLLNTDPDYLSGANSSSSTSSGNTSVMWDDVRAHIIADVGGMDAFEKTGFPNEHKVYLFAKKTANAELLHRAECEPEIHNGQVTDRALMCQHYYRLGERAWTFTLPMAETKSAVRRLEQLKRQLAKYRS
jgi:hypothetical protein